MQSGKVKTKFFHHQLELIHEFKEELEQMQQISKKALFASSQNVLATHISNLHQSLNEQIKKMNLKQVQAKKNIQENDAQGELEKQYIFAVMEAKVDELNNRLLQAEQNVQTAEQIKRQNDNKKMNYEMSNIKAFRKREERKYVQKYIELQKKIRLQFKRFIFLMSDWSELLNSQKSQLEVVVQQALKGIKYFEMRQNQMNKTRKCKSLTKIKKQRVKQKKGKNNLIEILLKSPKMTFLMKQSIKELLTTIIHNNKQQTFINEQLRGALEARERKQVREYLENKNNQLTFQESIAKLQLQAANLNENFQERLLSLKYFSELSEICERKNKMFSKEQPFKNIQLLNSDRKLKSTEKFRSSDIEEQLIESKEKKSLVNDTAESSGAVIKR